MNPFERAQETTRRNGGYWYLATPYSKYPGGLTLAFVEAARATAHLIKYGLPVYSPIAHAHPVADAGGMDKLDHSIWLPADLPLMRAAHGLIVCKMPTWDISYGIAEEIKVFRAAGKPVLEMAWPQPPNLACPQLSDFAP